MRTTGQMKGEFICLEKPVATWVKFGCHSRQLSRLCLPACRSCKTVELAEGFEETSERSRKAFTSFSSLPASVNFAGSEAPSRDSARSLKILTC